MIVIGSSLLWSLNADDPIRFENFGGPNSPPPIYSQQAVHRHKPPHPGVSSTLSFHSLSCIRRGSFTRPKPLDTIY